MAVITGTSGADFLAGTDGADEIRGLQGNDTLDGGTQADTLLGGDGRDLLIGGFAADLLNGGAGADTMEGGPGWDTYIVNHAGDVVSEDAAGGTQDAVQSSITYTLTAHVEYLTLTGSTDIDGTGNTGNNVITGNSGDNHLRGADGHDLLVGGAGNDELEGSSGNDTLEGGGGNDTLLGGSGNDLYIRDGTEVVVESADGGIDSVMQTAGLTAPDNVENFTYIGTADNIGFGGNELDNLITGNALNQTMRGGAGTDTISYSYETNPVTIDLGNSAASGSGDDFIPGFENALGGNAADTLTGSAVDNVLDGRGGTDTMEGGAGNDTYRVDDIDDAVVETDNGPGALADDQPAALDGFTDTVIAVVNYSLENVDFVENLTLDAAATEGTGNGLNNTITGNNRANTLSGLGGSDTLDGGAGNDVLNGGAAADTVSYQSSTTAGVVVSLLITGAQPTGGSGSDTLTSIERVTGSNFADQLTGNNSGNVLRGEGGSDTLNGRGGKDTLTGGAGVDKLVFSTVLNANTNVDQITDFTAGIDVIRMDNDIFTALDTGALAANALRSAAGAVTATNASHRIIYNETTGDLYYDADGGGGESATLFARLASTPTITAGDFFIIN